MTRETPQPTMGQPGGRIRGALPFDRESPVALGRPSPGVTDIIDKLQDAATKHTLRHKPLSGARPLVLPKSRKAVSLRQRSPPYDNSHDPNLQRRQLETWRTTDTGDTSETENFHDENNLFDPFGLGAVNSKDSIDKKIDQFLKKVDSVEANRDTRIPMAQSHLSPNKSYPKRSVSFDLSAPENEIKEIRKERKERKERNEQRIDNFSEQRKPLHQQDADPQQAPLQSEGEEEEEDDFFDLLVENSSSSSHGASDWFESLLQETANSNKPEYRRTRSEETFISDFSFPASSTKGQNIEGGEKGESLIESAHSSDSVGDSPTNASRNKNRTPRQSSPTWRSKGMSMTDHLIVSTTMEAWSAVDQTSKGKDTVTRGYSQIQKDPAGILANQLTASSSLSPSLKSGLTDETGETSDKDLDNLLKNISLVEFKRQSRKRKEKEQLQLQRQGIALLDMEVSKSLSSSSKSSDKSGPQEAAPKLVTKRFSSHPLNTRVQTVTAASDDDSSVFSNLPSGSMAQSFQLPLDSPACKCIPEPVFNYESRTDDCTLFSLMESDVALFEGQTAQRYVATTKSSLKLPGQKGAFTSCGETRSVTFEVDNRQDINLAASFPLEQCNLPSTNPCSPLNELESPSKVRAFWNSLVDLKTLGSFDSESRINEALLWTPQGVQPYIDRNPEEANVKSNDTVRHGGISMSLSRKSEDSSVVSSTYEPASVMPRRSNARYPSKARIPRSGPIPPARSRLRASSVWASSISDREHPTQELPQPVVDSVLYYMGPLMSVDSNEDWNTVVTDDFTKESASVVGQDQWCTYTCGGLDFASWGKGWF